MVAKKRNYQESKEAASFIAWCRLYPKIGNYIFHIPNEGNRSWGQNIRLVAEGMKAGVPDYFYFVPSGQYHGLFVELKSKSGSLSPHQKEFAQLAMAMGYQFQVCYGWIEAANAVREYRPYEGIPLVDNR